MSEADRLPLGPLRSRLSMVASLSLLPCPNSCQGYRWGSPYLQGRAGSGMPRARSEIA